MKQWKGRLMNNLKYLSVDTGHMHPVTDLSRRNTKTHLDASTAKSTNKSYIDMSMSKKMHLSLSAHK